MKKLLLIAFLWLLTGMTLAQSPIIYQGESFLLNENLSQQDDFQYIAGDSIVLYPGFNRNSHNYDYPPPRYFYTDFIIDELGVYPPFMGEQGGPLESDTGYVGSLGGSFDVGVLGGAVYSIPIELPTGINNMQPSLALSYNSQGGNGLAGWKWDLEGLSSITRTGSTLYHDEAMDGVYINDETDHFLLDGQRLIEVKNYGDSIDYKTEQDNFAKIRAYVEEKSINIFGVNHTFECVVKFKVWNPDGIILEYGFTNDARIEPQNGNIWMLCWLLNKASDRNGNDILYNYTENQETGEYYIESIEYTSNVRIGVNPQFTVRFGYVDRNDYEFGYVADNLIQRKKLLETITILNSDKTELMRYTLKYSETSQYAQSRYEYNQMYHRLTEISLEKDGKALNPTRITWEWEEKSSYQTKCFEKVQLNAAYFDKFVFVGDFNADGFSDVITVPYKPDSAYYPSPVDMNVLLNMGNGNFVQSPLLSMNNANGNPLANNLDWIHVIDINDDGYDDIIIQYYSPELYHNMGLSSLMLYINQGGEGFLPAWNSPVEMLFRMYLLHGDFLGEGKHSSLVFVNNNSNPTFMIPCYYIHSENGTYSHDTIANPEGWTANDVLSADFSGNGHSEIMVVNQTNGCLYNLTKDGTRYLLQRRNSCYDFVFTPELNLFPGDYNGDGKDDLLCYGKKTNSSDLHWFFLVSKGNVFFIKIPTCLKVTVWHLRRNFLTIL